MTVTSKLVIEMSVSDMLELRQLSGALHQIKRDLPPILKSLLKVKCLLPKEAETCEYLLGELELITDRARNSLFTITSYNEEEAKSYFVKSGKE